MARTQRRVRQHEMTELVPSIGWEIEEQSVTIKGKVSDVYKAISRKDNDNVLNIVKQSYEPMYNEELTKTVEKISELTNMKIAGYSEFDGGRKIIACLDNTTSNKIGDWPVDLKMIIGNTHDYSSSFFIGTNSTLIRCTNQFSQIHKSMRIQHTKSAEFKRAELMLYFQLYDKQSKLLLDTMEKMLKVPATQKMGNAMLNHVLGIKVPLDEISMKKRNQRAELEEAMRREIKDVGNNLFGLFNGVTYYTTHEKTLKAGHQKAYGNVWGTTAQLNNKAFEFALSKV